MSAVVEPMGRDGRWSILRGGLLARGLPQPVDLLQHLWGEYEDKVDDI